MFQESGIAQVIRNNDRFRAYRVFGDQAYDNDGVLASPFVGAIANLTRDQNRVYKSMSMVRVYVEWGCGQAVNYWTALDFKRQTRTGTQPVCSMYRVGVLLIDCLACANGGNTIGDYFGLHPPSLGEYLQFIVAFVSFLTQNPHALQSQLSVSLLSFSTFMCQTFSML
ncbi:hypothetical protein PC111_g22388 [Phytophthora cactorum]|nr:hypothetical protein PC111_g22388 [Phytophthora cactorum]